MIREPRVPGTSGVSGEGGMAATRVQAGGRHVRTLKNLLLALADDALPEDMQALEPARDVALWSGTRLTLQRVLLGTGVVGEKYQLTNLGNTSMDLMESALFKSGVMAVSVEQPSLRPGEATNVFVIRERAAMTETGSTAPTSAGRQTPPIPAAGRHRRGHRHRHRVLGIAHRLQARRRAQVRAEIDQHPGARRPGRSARCLARASRRPAARDRAEVARTDATRQGDGGPQPRDDRAAAQAGGQRPHRPAPTPGRRAGDPAKLRARRRQWVPAAAAVATAPFPQLPPPPPSCTNYRAGSVNPLPAPGSSGMPTSAPSAIVSITLADPVPDARPTTKSSALTPRSRSAAQRDTRRYIPSGAFTRALLLGGLDAPTGGQAQRNPQPVLMRLMDNAVLPNQFRSKDQGVFVVGAGYGDVSSERAYIRTESLSCITRDGTAIDVPDQGLCGRRRRQGRHARAPGLQAGPDPGQCAAGRRGQRHRTGVHPEFDHDVDLAAGQHQHHRARQAARGRHQHRRGQGAGPPGPVLHHAGREGFSGDRDRRRTHGRRRAHPGHRPARPAGRRHAGRAGLSATRRTHQPTQEIRR